MRHCGFAPLLQDVEKRRRVFDNLTKRLASLNIDIIVGLESSGYVMAAALADRLGLPLVMFRKPFGGLGWENHASYNILNGKQILVIDDLLVTGKTLESAITTIKAKFQPGLIIVCVLAALTSFQGRTFLETEHPDVPVICVSE